MLHLHERVVELYDRPQDRRIPTSCDLGGLQSGFLCIHPFVTVRPRFAAPSAPAMLPPGIRGRPVYQPGASHRARTRNGITKPWAKLQGGTRANTILAIHHYILSIIKIAIPANSKNALQASEVPEEKKPAWCFNPSNGARTFQRRRTSNRCPNVSMD